MASHPTDKRRNRRKKLKARYAKLREDLQLSGDLETTPAGAIHDERVDPRTQGCQQLPQLIRRALAEGWDVPDSAKRDVVAELLLPFLSRDEPRDPNLLNRLARTLLLLDQTQYDRDQTEEDGRAKGGGGAVAASVQANDEVAALIREMAASVPRIQ